MKHHRPAPLAIQGPVTLETIEALCRFLKEKGTFDLYQLSNGLFPAASRECRTASASGYENIWVRDNIHIAYACHEIGQKARARRCAMSLGAFFRKHDNRFRDVVNGKADPGDPMQRPHIRFNGRGLKEIRQPWSHAQNDAIGYFLWFYSRLIREGIIKKKDADIDLLAITARYLSAIQFWKDKDSGHWEEERKVAASSVGIALVGLLEFEKVLSELNLKSRFRRDSIYHLSTKTLRRLIGRGWRSLNKILPYECLEKDPAVNRPYDSALLFLIEPVELLDVKMSDLILSLVKKYLEGRHGVRRYLMDSYWCPDYRRVTMQKRSVDITSDNRERNKLAKLAYEAQWCIFDPLISTIYGKRFLKSGLEYDRQRQITYFKRAISQITDDRFEQPYRCPEAWFYENGKYVPNDQVPLTWAQANLLVAFKYMKLSLKMPPG